MGGILDFKGKAATAGTPCLYTLTGGQVLYSESAREDGDSFIFDGDKTLLMAMRQGKAAGQMDITMQKLSEGPFKTKQTRVLKTAVLLIQDCGEPALQAKAHEALSGLTLPSGTAMN